MMKIELIDIGLADIDFIAEMEYCQQQIYNALRIPKHLMKPVKIKYRMISIKIKDKRFLRPIIYKKKVI